MHTRTRFGRDLNLKSAGFARDVCVQAAASAWHPKDAVQRQADQQRHHRPHWRRWTACVQHGLDLARNENLPRPSVVSMVKVFCVALKTQISSVIIFGLRTSSQNFYSIRIRAVMCCHISSQFGKRAVAAQNTFPFRKRERASQITSVFQNVLNRYSTCRLCRPVMIMSPIAIAMARRSHTGL